MKSRLLETACPLVYGWVWLVLQIIFAILTPPFTSYRIWDIYLPPLNLIFSSVK